MEQYHKIQTIFKRESEKPCRIIEGQYADSTFEYLAHNEWVFTEKVDGTNIRVMVTPERVRFGGKTDNAQIPAFLVDRLNELFGSPERQELLRDIFPDGGCLYGEGYGARIQKDGGNYRPDGVNFVLFDVRVGPWWLERTNVAMIATRLDVEVVPIVGSGTLPQMVERVRQGMKSVWGEFDAEGIVARPATELQTRAGKRIITKLKTRDFQRGPQ